MAPVDSDVIGAEFDLTIASGRSLVAKDGSGFLGLGKAKTSDPYVKIIVGGRALAETNVCKKTLSPEWNQTFKLHLDGRAYRPREALILAVFDHDRTSSDDPMGEVRLPLESLQGGQVMDKWYKVENCRGCNDASGELRIRVSCLLRHALSLEARQTAPLPRSTGTVAVGLGWDPLPGNRAIDLDASCVAMDFRGRVMKEESVYFGQLLSRSRALRHTGDELTGEADLGQGDDEVIVIDLPNLPSQLCALHFIATVSTEGKSFADVKTARMRLVNWKTGHEECRFSPASAGAHTAIFFARLARKSHSEPWVLQTIGEADHTARDWGTLVPELQMYTRDLVPGLQVDINSRVAILRKGGLVRLSDYAGGAALPSNLVLGLYWDVTDGINIDLDASAIMLDAELKQIDLVYFGKLRSSDGSIQHGGDEREGDEKGDDEQIFIRLGAVHPAVAHIFFVINSYSGQELDDVKDAGCHLFDGSTGRDLARFEMTGTQFLDKHTALLVGDLFRDASSNGDWAFEIASLARQGRTANLNVPHVVDFLRKRPARQLPPPRPPPGVGSFMLRNTASSAMGAAANAARAVGRLARTASGKLVEAVGQIPQSTLVATSPPMGLPVVHVTPPPAAFAAAPPQPHPLAPPLVVATGVPVPVPVPVPVQAPVDISAAAPAPVPGPPPQPQQAQPADSAGTGKSALESLKELKQLLDAGLVTQGEFDAKKAELLARL